MITTVLGRTALVDDHSYETPESSQSKTKGNDTTVDPTFVPGDEGSDEEDVDELDKVSPKEVRGLMDADKNGKKTQIPGSTKNKRKRGDSIDPTYVPGEDDDEDEDLNDAKNKHQTPGSNKSKTKKKKTVDPTYVPGREEDGKNLGNGNDRKATPETLLRLMNSGSKLDQNTHQSGSNKSKKKKRDVDPTYVPGKDDDDEELDGSLPAGDEQADGTTTPRSLRKRKRTSDTSLGDDKKSTPPRTPKRRRRSLGHDPQLPLFPHLVDYSSEKPEKSTYPIEPLPQKSLGYLASNLPAIEWSSFSGFFIPRRRSHSEPPGDHDSLWRRKSDSNLISDDGKSSPFWGLSPPEKTRKSSSIYEDYTFHPGTGTASKDQPKPIKSLSDDEDYNNDDNDDEDDYLSNISVPKSETKSVTFDFSVEKAKRWADAISLPEGLWSKAEKELFFRLAMRGFEPIIPSHWQFDFGTLPGSLFAVSGYGRAPLIQACRGSDFYAIKSLISLFSLGGRVRDCSILQIRPEPVIKRAIKKYLRWALYDANVQVNPGAIPVHAIYSQKKGESTLRAVRKLNRRLEALSQRYRDALELPFRLEESSPSPEGQIKQEIESVLRSQRRFPLLVGFVICGPIVAILTLDTDPLSKRGWSKGTGSKFISQFDLGEYGQDAWSSLAVAIAIMRIRRTMIELADDCEGGFCKVPDGIRLTSDEDL
ncbi:hypothetical protein AWENTII_007985 [Aspergillus wentii]|nr:hypothetical protein MW887_002309 [Aspergillus wentii]